MKRYELQIVMPRGGKMRFACEAASAAEARAKATRFRAKLLSQTPNAQRQAIANTESVDPYLVFGR